ncbi:uncharacterized protein LOC111356944 [Spodoptera litura]|uniref:Uncharacterized protein LOC111356944 n=1 Tax=Spodoptera litura TaxID=69820 RepID=A0A9J7EBS1_SPOLT|nr:uncharacterized protein LOC111356944 [Spodoptera litura]
MQTKGNTDVLLGETFRVGVRTPPFNPSDPELWFAQIEGQFILSNISTDATKFYFVLAQLEPQHAAEIRDLVVSPPASAKYDTIKAELIRRLSASKERKIKQLLMHEEMGDRKPTQFLRHLQHLAGQTVPPDFIKTIWTSRLPTHLQTCIAAQQEKMALEDLAELADRVHDVVPVTIPGPNQVASTSEPTTQIEDNAIEALTRTVAELSRRVEAMSVNFERNSRSRSITRNARDRPRSRSRPIDHPHCWYHYHFGERARRCTQPCTFKKSENYQGSH